ncbi:MAG: alanine--glyoxylate aminotransferase family protein, partial [Roseovarius confluentis]
CEAWSAEGPLRLNIPDAAHRSRAVTSLAIGKPLGEELRQWVEAHMGVTLGIGLGMQTEEDPRSTGYFRIGHMGHLNGHALLGVLGAVEAGLTALNIAHGDGAVQKAAQVLAAA